MRIRKFIEGLKDFKPETDLDRKLLLGLLLRDDDEDRPAKGKSDRRAAQRQLDGPQNMVSANSWTLESQHRFESQPNLI